MALQGSLQEYNMGQLLNLIHIAHKSGGLTVQSSRGAAELFFDEGKLIAANSGQPQTLTDLMVRAGKLTRDQATNLAASSGAVDDKQLGLLLLNTGQITRDDIVQTLRQTMLNTVQTVWEWEDGQFVFDQTRTPPAGRVTIPIGLERLLVEAGRPRTEPAPAAQANTLHPPTPTQVTAPAVQADLPSLDLALRFTEGFGEQLRSINLTPKEWKAISAINPRNSVREVARRAGMSEAEIQETVMRLLREGLVVVAGLPETEPEPSDAATPTATTTTASSTQLVSIAVPVPAQSSTSGATSYTALPQQPEPALAEPSAEPEAKPGAVKRFLSRFGKS